MTKRFEWKFGPTHPDKDAKTAILWDNQEHQIVMTLHEKYRQLICLECQPFNGPFTDTEKWVNALDSETLETEGIPGYPPKSVFNDAGFEPIDENVWGKNDRRGKEYGEYQATWASDVGGAVKVTYFPKSSSKPQYDILLLSKEDFLEWASDHT